MVGTKALATTCLALLATAGVTARANSLSVVSEPLELTAGGCKSAREQVGPCSVEFKVCYGFYKRKWRYTATACASGVCGQSGHTKSAKGAAEEAAKALFARGPSCMVQGAPVVVFSVPSVLAEEVSPLEDAMDLSDSEASAIEAELNTLGDADAAADEQEAEQLAAACKKLTKQVGTCSISFKVCGKISKLKWKYDATACASGKCASAGGFKSAKGAAETAAKKLFTAPLPACAIPAQVQADDGVAAPPMKLAAPAVPEMDLSEEFAEGFAHHDVHAEYEGEVDEAEQLAAACKKLTKQVGTCSISFKVCGKISKLKWKYDATACASGKCASAGGFKSAKGAAETAAKKLFTAPLPACAIPTA